MRPLKLLPFAAGFAFLVPAASSAQTASGPQLNVNHVRYDATGTGLAVASSPSTLGLLQGGGGVSLHLADRPFVIYDARTDELSAWGTVIQSSFVLDLHGAFGFGFLDIGASLPVAPALVWGGDPTGGDFPVGEDDEGAVGDLVLTPKVRILDPQEKIIGFGVQIPVGLPTGQAARYFGDGGVNVSVDVLVEVNVKNRFRFVANISPIHLRPEVKYGSFERLAVVIRG